MHAGKLVTYHADDPMSILCCYGNHRRWVGHTGACW